MNRVKQFLTPLPSYDIAQLQTYLYILGVEEGELVEQLCTTKMQTKMTKVSWMKRCGKDIEPYLIRFGIALIKLMENKLAQSALLHFVQNKNKWQWVHLGLFSSDPYAQQRCVSRVASWRSRMQLPVAIDATAQLVELQLHESMAQQHHHAVGVSSRSHMELSLLYANIIVRCVNGLVDSSQKGAYALAVSTLAQRIGIPLWIVDLRHESTHNQLPSLSVLRFAARHLLAWLQVNYWEAQEDLIRGQVYRLGQWLLDKLPHLIKKSTDDDQQDVPLRDNAMQLPTTSMTKLDADTLRNIVVPLLVDGQQYGESVAPTGLLFLEAPVLLETGAKEAPVIFQRDAFVCLLLRLQPLWRRFSASLLARLCQKVLNFACPLKSIYSYDNETEQPIQGIEEKPGFKQNEMEMTLQWIKFMVSSDYRERVKLQIGPIEDMCHCGAEMLALVDTLKSKNLDGCREELLERLKVTLKSSKAIRNYSTLLTEAAIGTSLASEKSVSGWTQLPTWTESPIGFRYSYSSIDPFQICEYSLDDDSLTPDSSRFVAFDEEEGKNINKTDADDVIDALMEDLDAAYDATLQQTVTLQATIGRDGLQQGGSTTVLPRQELVRIQEEIEIW
ncbi:hypothetical protein PsorP6_008811 [Peronosclerospora sorghi]|uniref:Uncharacterized protein n=1 Tax=Peronosclerospora sorghi TaxID=230839 RepID=A0ACC0VYD9_9STRA|nr:hypothetical protein PsorP6_008811 [Peronosclerospora sorghi]